MDTSAMDSLLASEVDKKDEKKRNPDFSAIDSLLTSVVDKKEADKEKAFEVLDNGGMDALYKKHRSSYMPQLAAGLVSGFVEGVGTKLRGTTAQQAYVEFFAGEDRPVLKNLAEWQKIDASVEDRKEKHWNIVKNRSIDGSTRAQLFDLSKNYRSDFKYGEYTDAVEEAKRRNLEKGASEEDLELLEPEDWPITPRHVTDEDFENTKIAKEDPATLRRYKALRGASERVMDRLSPYWVDRASSWSQDVEHSKVGKMFLSAAENVNNLATGVLGKVLDIPTGFMGSMMAYGAMAMQEEGGFMQNVDPLIVDGGLPHALAERYAREYGALSGVLEYSETMLNIGTLGGAGRISKYIAASFPAKSMLAKFGKWGAGKLGNAAMEGFEELSQSALQYYLTEKMLGEWAEKMGKEGFSGQLDNLALPIDPKTGKVDWGAAWGELAEAFEQGAGVSLAFGAIGTPVSMIRGAKNIQQQRIKKATAAYLAERTERIKIYEAEHEAKEAQRAADKESFKKNAKESRKSLDEGVASEWIENNPDKLEEIAKKEKLSRTDWTAMGLPNVDAAVRNDFLKRIKDSLTEKSSEVETKEDASTVDEKAEKKVEPKAAEKVEPEVEEKAEEQADPAEPKVEEEVEEKAKELWQMTKEEQKASGLIYGSDKDSLLAEIEKKEPRPLKKSQMGNLAALSAYDNAKREWNKVYHPAIRSQHQRMVEQAIAEGKPVPAEVLAEYPELAKKAEVAPAATASTPPKVEPKDAFDMSEEDLDAFIDSAIEEAESVPAKPSPVRKPKSRGKKTQEANVSSMEIAPKIGEKGIKTKADAERSAMKKRMPEAVHKDVETLHGLFGASKKTQNESASQFQDFPANTKKAFDEDIYKKAAPSLRNIFTNFQESGKSLGDFIRTVFDMFGDDIRPYVHRVIKDLAQEAKQNKGIENDKGIRASNQDGRESGGIEASGRGDGTDGGTIATDGTEQSTVESARKSDDSGLSTGDADDSGSSKGDGISTTPVGVGQQQANRRGGRTVPGDRGDGLASKDVGPNNDGTVKTSPVVHAPNGNLDLRNAEPVVLTKKQRKAINAQVDEIIRKPLEDVTDADREILRQYTGIGGLGIPGRGLIDQFYTPYETIKQMFRALTEAKVPMRVMVEPSVGSGSFVGHMPNANWTTVELDKKNYEVVRRLYPNADHYNASYEDVTLSGADVIISNIPFMEIRPVRKRHSGIKALHDFFFVQALEQVRPDGVVAFIAPTGVMDKKDSSVRKQIVAMGDIVGAYRLPEGHFKNAHTQVSSDIIFVQRRGDGVPARTANASANDAFVQTVVDEESGARRNKWYEDSPDSVLGETKVTTDRFGKKVYATTGVADTSQIHIGYSPYGSQDVGTKTQERGTKQSKSTKKERKQMSRLEFNEMQGDNPTLITSTRLGDTRYLENIRIRDGVVYELDYEIESFNDFPDDGGKVFKPMAGENAKKILALSGILDSANRYQSGIAAEADIGIEAIRNYENDFKTSPHNDKALKKVFRDAGEARFFKELTSTFDAGFEPAKVFSEKTKHTGSGKYKATSDSDLFTQAKAAENNQGVIDTSNKDVLFSQDDVPTLLEAGYSVIGMNGTSPILQNDVLYYSGNIYKKIEALETLSKRTPDGVVKEALKKQLKRLVEIIPERRLWEDINIHGTEDWLAPILKDAGVNVNFSVKSDGEHIYRLSGIGLGLKNLNILEKHLNGRDLISQKKGESSSAFRSRMLEAEGILQEIMLQLKTIVAERPDLAERAEDEFNKRFRNYVAPDYMKASYLLNDVLAEIEETNPTVYSAKLRKRVPLRLRENQIRWITKALIEGRGINAHDVGGGKTLSAIVLVRALKLRGVAQKPMMVVPAKTIKKWIRETKLVYPNAKIVDLGKLESGKRDQMLFDLSTSNADYVYISHEGFGQIKLPSDVEAQYVEQIIDEGLDAPEVMRTSRAKAMKEAALSQKYVEALQKEPRDTRLTFDKLGVDCIIADEAHAFKNVGVSAGLAGVGFGKAVTFKAKKPKKGSSIEPAPTLDSARAYDFRFKANWITENNNGNNIFMLTATPTPNKPMELYTMLRHFGRDVLAEYGIHSDRDFAKAFFREKTRENSQGKKRTIMSSIVNALDFRSILDRFTDKLSMEDMPYIEVPKANYIQHYLDSSIEYETIAQDLRNRFLDLGGEGNEDSAGAIFSGGRSASVSPTLYGGKNAGVQVKERSYDHRNDKIAWILQYVTKVAKGNKNAGQLIFVDSTGAQRAKEGHIKKSVHQELKDDFVAKGFDPKEVVIVNGEVMTDLETGKETSGGDSAQRKADIQDAYNKGTVKIMIGSTQAMGEGMDLQVKTTDIYHMDIPYTPGEFRQRNGRGIRFGNENASVNIHYLMMRGTFDQVSFDINQGKQGWNEAIWDKQATDVISTEQEMLDGAIPSEKQIAIELEKDPVKQQELRASFELESIQKEQSEIGSEISAAIGKQARLRDSVKTNEKAVDYWGNKERDIKPDDRIKDEAERKQHYDDRVDYMRSMREKAEARVAEGKKAQDGLLEQIEELNRRFKEVRQEYEAVENRYYDEDHNFIPDMALVETETIKQEEERKKNEWMDEEQFLDMPSPASTEEKSRGKSRGKKRQGDKIISPTENFDKRKTESTGEGKTGKPLLSRADLINLVRKEFPGLAIRGRATWRRKNASGWFDRANNLIRTNDPFSIDVISHELGHYIDAVTQAMKEKLPQKVKAELTKLGHDIYGNKKPVGGFKAEGWAEFVRGLLTSSEEMNDVCPETLSWFYSVWMPKHQASAASLMKIQEAINTLRDQSGDEAVKAFYTHKNPNAIASTVSWIRSRFNYHNWVDGLHFLHTQQREAGIDVDVHNDKLTPEQKAEAILMNPYLKATLYNKSGGRKTVEMATKQTTNLVGNKRTGESLFDALELVRGIPLKLDHWMRYAVARQANEYHKRGLESGLSQAEIDDTIAKFQSEEFDTTLDRVTEWSRRILHLLVENGAMTQEEFDKIEKTNPIYIKFMRVFNQDQVAKRKMAAGKTVYRRRGGTQGIEDPIAAMLVDAQKIIEGAQQADVARCIVDAMKRAEPGSAVAEHWIVKVPAPKTATIFSAEKIKGDVAQIAVDRMGVDPMLAEQALENVWTEKLTVFQDSARFNGKEKIVSIVLDGKREFYEVKDDRLFELLNDYTTPPSNSDIAMINNKIVTSIRLGATIINPRFGIMRNPLRDTLTAFNNSDYHTHIPIISVVHGMILDIIGTDSSKIYHAMGLDLDTLSGQNLKSATHLAKQVKAANKFQREMKAGLIHVASGILSHTEIGPRLMEFRGAFNHWEEQTHSSEAAAVMGALASGDLTVNFRRSGKYGAKASRITIFANAGIQSIDKFFNMLGLTSSKPWQKQQSRLKRAGRTLARGGLSMTAQALIAYALHRDEEWWLEMTPQEKWGYFHYRIGGKTVKIPLPFEPGMFFAALPVAILEERRNPGAIRDCLALMIDNLPFQVGGFHDILRNASALAPVVDVVANRNWAGSELLPEHVKKTRQPVDWTSNNTGDTAQAIGKAIWKLVEDTPLEKMAAPVYIEHLLNQYSGGMYKTIAGSVENIKDPSIIGAGGDLSTIPVVGTIFLRHGSSKLSTEFYDRMERLVQANGSNKITLEELGELRDKQATARELSKIFEKRRNVMKDDLKNRGTIKVESDAFIQEALVEIRKHNNRKKYYRVFGIRSAATMLTNPGSTTKERDEANRLLEDVSMEEIQRELKKQVKMTGGNTELKTKNHKMTPFGERIDRLKRHKN